MGVSQSNQRAEMHTSASPALAETRWHNSRSVTLVCLLFVVSFGWYLFVWAYKTWKFIRQESGQAISPTLRTASLVVRIVHDIFLFQLFKYVVDLTAEADAEGDSPPSRRMPEFDSKMVAFWAGFSFLSYVLGVRGPLSLIGLASVFFLVPIQMRINRHSDPSELPPDIGLEPSRPLSCAIMSLRRARLAKSRRDSTVRFRGGAT